MMFVKENLLKTDYVWNDEGKFNLLSDGPTRKRFDQFSGNCMLHIINLYDNCIDKLTVAQAQTIECLIQKELPLETRSEVTVLQWLKEKHVQIFSLEVV